MKPNNQKSILQRFISSTVSCGLIFADSLSFTRFPGTNPWSLDSYDLSRIFIRRENAVLAVFLPLLSTSLLFLAPIWCEWRSGRFVNINGILNELRYSCDIIRFRSVVLAPIVEEIIFRGCILFQLQRQFQTCGALCLFSGLLFAVAHLHHVVEMLYLGYPLNMALSEVLPQVIMTAIFGVYSTLIVLRSGHLIAACIVHSFCNAMGAPDIPGDLKYLSLRHPRWGKRIYLSLLFSGFIGWLLLIGPATTLFGLSDTTLCRLF
nr:CAAX prenyl protease 2 [Hymenolepis microstoma]